MTPPGAAEAFHLDVGDGHRVHVALWGNRGGLPVAFLHGGPGSGCNPGQRVIFDPDRHRVAFIDQRGAGQSLPHGARHANTTAHLVADLERVRAHLGLAAWHLVGGSWGATLALAYAQAHPDRVRGLILRAVFLGTRAELDWAFGTGLSRFHPALHRDFIARLPVAARHDPLPAYWRRILDPDPAIHRQAAFDWHDTERILSELSPPATRLPAPDPDGTRALPASPFMEAHYFAHDCFLADKALLQGMGRIAHLPGIVIQGRYDLLCPPASADAVVARWPAARLKVIAAAGHAMGHPGIIDALRSAIRDIIG